MTDESEERQPPLTLGHISFCRGELEGKPCLVAYDAAEDKTSVVAHNSKFYANAMAALEILMASTVKLPKSLANPKTIVTARKPKLILPGSMASN